MKYEILKLIFFYTDLGIYIFTNEKENYEIKI